MAKPCLIHSKNTYGTLEKSYPAIKVNACQRNSKNNIELGISATVNSRVLEALPMKVLGSLFLSHCFMVMKSV